MPIRLPEHETAYAMTVHKSQGSEFERVLMVLPREDSAVLTRELVYTGLTRASKEVELWSDQGIFATAVRRRISRRSGLREALWQNQGDAQGLGGESPKERRGKSEWEDGGLADWGERLPMSIRLTQTEAVRRWVLAVGCRVLSFGSRKARSGIKGKSVIVSIRRKRMGIQDQSIKRKTMAVIMLTSVAVLLLTAVAFTAYDLITYRQDLVHSLAATAAIIADHSGRRGAAGRERRAGDAGVASGRPAHRGGGAGHGRANSLSVIRPRRP